MPAGVFCFTGMLMTPEEIAELRQRRYNGTVVSLKKLHSDLMVIRVKPDFPRPGRGPSSARRGR